MCQSLQEFWIKFLIQVIVFDPSKFADISGSLNTNADLLTLYMKEIKEMVKDNKEGNVLWGSVGRHAGQGQGQAEKLGQGLGGTLLQLVPESKGSQSDQKASGNTEISNVPDEAGLVVSAGGADSQVGSELVNVVAANLLGDQPVNQTVPMGVEEDSDNPCENIQSLIWKVTSFSCCVKSETEYDKVSII